MHRSKALVTTLSFGLIACISAEAKPIRGLYFWGHEVETFHPCGTDKAYWIVGEESLLEPLRDKAKQASATRHYQPIYVEIVAVSEGKATDGFAADYDGVYRLKSVATVSSSAPSGCVADG